ncbi:MAG: MFS transporter [Bacteroidales bacterium]|nr:MFS transporter [Bacteroidales bacterium]
MRALIRKYNYIPVLATFFVMGFCDVVGIATSYVKQDFGLSEGVAGFIPSMVFIWFLLVSIPAAMLMNKLGRKTMVQISNAVTFVGMLIPFFSYSLVSVMAAFVMLGIGNTILQISLNPLLSNVVEENKLSSSLTGGQVVKALSSFSAPFLALLAVNYLGNWKFLFTIYAGITLLSFLLLELTFIPREEVSSGGTGMRASFSLLKDRTVLLTFLGIAFIVGIDVGVNTVSPKLLIERCSLPVEKASLGSSAYFICRTVGAFIGVWLLSRMNDIKYLKINLFCAAAAMGLLFFAQSMPLILVGVAAVGFFCSSVFSVLFSQALKARPEKSNEISGFMITGVAGGAVIPPLMGLSAQLTGNQTGSLVVLALCLIYLIYCAFAVGSQRVATKE